MAIRTRTGIYRVGEIEVAPDSLREAMAEELRKQRERTEALVRAGVRPWAAKGYRLSELRQVYRKIGLVPEFERVEVMTRQPAAVLLMRRIWRRIFGWKHAKFLEG
jgi:hypothetical protein